MWGCIGGFAVRSASLNLLRYPRRWPRERTAAAVSAAAGLLAGALLAMVWGLWTRSMLPAWTSQRDALALRVSQQTLAQSRHAQAAQQARLQQLAQTRDASWQMQRAQLIRLHALLDRAAADQGLRVHQWQGSDKRLQLQASLPHARDWPVLQAQLTDAGPQAWQLQSLALDTDGVLHLVLEASWAATAQAPQAKRP